MQSVIALITTLVISLLQGGSQHDAAFHFSSNRPVTEALNNIREKSSLGASVTHQDVHALLAALWLTNHKHSENPTLEHLSWTYALEKELIPAINMMKKTIETYIVGIGLCVATEAEQLGEVEGLASIEDESKHLEHWVLLDDETSVLHSMVTMYHGLLDIHDGI